MWNYHVKSNPALPFTLFDTLASFTRKVLGEFKDGKDRFFKLKYAQYEWIRISLENIRRNKGFINGIIYWMWNDCWPAAGGWAFVDYYLLPKASFYSFKRCASGVVCSIDKKSDYEFYVCNDTLDTVPLALSISYLLKGKYTHVKTVPIVAKSSCSERYFSLPISDIPECATVICNISGTNVSDRAFYKNGSLPIVPCTPPRILAQTADSITLTADSYIHAVELEGEYVFGDNYFSLLPGETKTVTKRATDTAVSEELTVSAYTLSE